MDKIDSIIEASLAKLDKYISEQAPAEEEVPPQQVPPQQMQQQPPPQEGEDPSQEMQQQQMVNPQAELAPGMDPNMAQDPSMMGMDPGAPNPEIEELDVDTVAADPAKVRLRGSQGN